jgi:alpha-galactosidase
MLQVGNVGLTVIESRSHFAIWCFLAAPLLIGTDLHTATNETIAILGAKELIKVDQDPLGFQARREFCLPSLANPRSEVTNLIFYYLMLSNW